MSELSVINQTKECNTVKTLIRDFIKIGIKEGDTVLVHSSLSSIGWVCGSEAAVVEALIHTVGQEGTVCMPAHSSDNSDPAKWENPPVPKEWIDTIYENMPAFHPDITPTRGMGRIAELFRKYPGVLRSNHPQTSFSAKGRFAKEITDNHILTPQLGMETPLGKLYQRDAKVLLLGVGYTSCTCFHLAEVISECAASIKTGAAIETGRGRVWQWFEDYDYNSDDFDELGIEFEKSEKVTEGYVGNAVCKMFDIRKGVDFAVSWLDSHRGMHKTNF